MGIDQDLAVSVRSWLQHEEAARADRILDEILPGIAAVPQRRSPWTMRRPGPWPGEVAVVLATAALVVIVAVIGRVTASPDDGVAAPTAPAPTPAVAPTSSVQAFPPDDLGDGEVTNTIPPGRAVVGWVGGASGSAIEVTVPPGWGQFAGPSNDQGIFKRHGYLYGFPADLQAGSVTWIVRSLCAEDPVSGEVGPTFVDPGPSVDDLVAGLRRVIGMNWSEPTAVLVDGYRAQRLETTFRPDCPGPVRRTLWGQSGEYFVESRATTTVLVIDVDGRRLVVATHVRPAATDEDRADVATMLESITIEPGTGPMPAPTDRSDRVFPSAMGPDADLRVGRHWARIEGIGFTFEVADRGWEPQRGFTITRSTSGSQGAEGIVRWTTIPHGADTQACSLVLDPAIGPSAGALAEAMASAPGLEVGAAPQRVVVGGRAAMHLVVEVATDVGCDPGYFSVYDAVDGGAMWTHTEAGDRMLVWIVEVDGVALVIEGGLHANAGSRLEDDIRAIVESMTFE